MKLIVSDINNSLDYYSDDKVDVIVPCYNVEKYISRCLDSILNQTIGLDRIRIIAVNDGSTDGTLDVLKKYETKYSENICIVDCNLNSGPGNARNIGLEYATEKYLTFVDSDDCLRIDMLEKLVHFDKCYPSDVVTCDYEAFTTTIPPKTDESDIKSDVTVVESELDRRQLFYYNAIENPVWGKLYRTEFIKEHKDIFFPSGVKMEDIYFSYMVVAYAQVWQHVQARLYNYFLNNNGIMKSFDKRYYYMDVFYVFSMAMEKYREIGILDYLKEEAAHIYYLKVFKNLIAYMSDTFGGLQLDEANVLIDYIKEFFPDIMDNPHLCDDDKDILKGILD